MLSDGVIKLRALEPTDLDILYRWENDSSLWSIGATIAPFSRKQLWDYIENYDGDIFTARQLRFIVEDLDTKTAVGTIDLYDFDPVNNRAWVGILIDASKYHQGYATRALAIVDRYAKERIGIHQLLAVVPENNEWSLRLFAKCGYVRTADLVDWLRNAHGYQTAHLFRKILD